MNLDKLAQYLGDTMESVVQDKIENLKSIKGEPYANAVSFAFKIIMFQASSVHILQAANLKDEIASLMNMLYERALFDIMFSHFSLLKINPADALDVFSTAHAMVEEVQNQTQVGFKLAQV